MIQGIAGVIIWTGDLDNLLNFYQDTLGLLPHSIHPNFVSFKWENMRLGIGSHDKISGHAKDPVRIMVNWRVSNIVKEYKKLTNRGVVFTRPPEQEHWGGWVATFSDPDGNILQLLQLR